MHLFGYEFGSFPMMPQPIPAGPLYSTLAQATLQSPFPKTCIPNIFLSPAGSFSNNMPSTYDRVPHICSPLLHSASLSIC